MTYKDFLINQGEKKWQDHWEVKKLFAAEDFSDKPKFYCLIEFPYPSGEGLHIGHPRSYTALDILARKRRMDGQNVLYPIGFDAFGLPAENYAIKTGTHPRIKTEENINNFRRQLKSLGFSFDWSREINTTDPQYYKWTQWIFLQLFKNGLAYKTEMPINFCTSCKVGLANEEVVDGKCERCGGEVVMKNKKQWMLKITQYADRLAQDLDLVDYLEKIKSQQINWIGKSQGAEVEFRIKNQELRIKVYTTRPDTLFGATYMVLSPEHELVQNLKSQIENWSEVENYINQAKKKSDLERTELNKEKTGVELQGVKAINPVNNQEIPIWLSDYVLASYGTGAIMAVPAHDERDFEFAKKFSLEIKFVIIPDEFYYPGQNGEAIFLNYPEEKDGILEMMQDTNGGICYTNIDAGKMINSEFLNGLTPAEAIKKMTSWLEEKGFGKKAINYKLRDWVFSRQRYWGESIPIIECEKCGFVPLEEKDLPLELPEIKEFQTGDDGQSPLAKLTDWVNVKCPKCGGVAKRETDTMPQWAGSSWYFLRYMDPHNNKALADQKKLKYWSPVDWYNGGMEHTTLHLLYSRFWHKFLFDIGVVPTSEPYAKRTSHGMILGEGGEKMSKSRGNVVNPDDLVREYGADTLRVYEMFMGPFDQAIPWDSKGVIGVYRFLDKIWNFYIAIIENKKFSDLPKDVQILLNKTIKKVGEDIEAMKYNTAISAMMILINKFMEIGSASKFDLEKFLKILSPFAPHMSEELWQMPGHKKSLALESWPAYDQNLIQDESVEFIVQVNGKLRAKIILPADISEAEAVEAAKQNEQVQKYLAGQEIKKTVFVPKKLISFVCG